MIGWTRQIKCEPDRAEADADIDNKCIRDKISIAVSACDNAAKHYDDYAKSFIALDTKAQATAVISGLILASVAAFVKDGRVAALHGSQWWILLFLAAPIAALLAVIISLLGSHIREVTVPFDAPAQIHDVQNLTALDCTEFSSDDVLIFHQERLKHWSAALTNVRDVMEDKATWVARGQKAMILSPRTSHCPVSRHSSQILG
ncbi:MAG TPA: hypothetical protein VH117_02910 [Edaphobacter sp.]|nr:hypothetical protein [Edaphobacter sp.]